MQFDAGDLIRWLTMIAQMHFGIPGHLVDHSLGQHDIDQGGESQDRQHCMENSASSSKNPAEGFYFHNLMIFPVQFY